MKKLLAFAVILLFSVVLFTGCIGGGGTGGDTPRNNIVLLTGMFSEITILIHMAGHLITEHTDLTVTFHDSMATVPAATALERGQVDLFVGYDGTMLTTLLGYDPSDVPPGELLFDWAVARGEEERGLTLIGKFGFDNTYVLAVHQEFANEHNLRTVSDLIPFAPDLIFGAEHEFFDIEGTMRFIPFNEHYGLQWRNGISMDIGLKYAAMDANNIDVTMVYSTDGLNQRFNLFLLEDDLAFFPEYNASFQTRATLFEEFAETAPNLEEVLSKLNGMINTESMIGLNYAVDVLNQDISEVARQFLIDNGLL